MTRPMLPERDPQFIDAKLLRKAYDKAVQDGLDVFEFQGHPMLTKYAHYLLEYLEGPARV